MEAAVKGWLFILFCEAHQYSPFIITPTKKSKFKQMIKTLTESIFYFIIINLLSQKATVLQIRTFLVERICLIFLAIGYRKEC